MNQERKTGNRWTLWLLLALFLGPLILAWVLYFTDAWKPAGQAHHGALVEPAVNLLVKIQDDELKQALQGKWTLIQVTSKDCGAVCDELTTRIRQVRLALGHRRDRVHRVLLQKNAKVLSNQDQDPTLSQLTIQDDSALMQTLIQHRRQSVATSIYMSDPLGNLVIVYPADVEQRSLLEDVKRLLRLSRIG